jgi:hypothetical protein
MSSQPLDATSVIVHLKDRVPIQDALKFVFDSMKTTSLLNDTKTTAITTIGTRAPSFDFTSTLSPEQIPGADPPLVAQRSDDMLDIIPYIQCGFKSALISPTLPAMPDLNKYKETKKQLDILMSLQKVQQSRVQ